MSKFGTILTAQGEQRIAACILDGTRLDIAQAAVGDGGGAYYLPDRTQTALRNERWRGAIAAAEINSDHPNMVDVKIVLGPEVSGFFAREAALYTADGVMIALCNLPDTEKPALSEGVSGRLSLLFHLVVQDASVLQFVLSPSLDTVSREELSDALSAHDHAPDAHPELQAVLGGYFEEAEPGEARPNSLYGDVIFDFEL